MILKAGTPLRKYAMIIAVRNTMKRPSWPQVDGQRPGVALPVPVPFKEVHKQSL